MLSSLTTGVSGIMLEGRLFLSCTSNFSKPGTKKKMGELLLENQRNLLLLHSGLCTIDSLRVKTSSSKHLLPGTFRLNPKE